MSDTNPRFTDQQMALILKRAAELQATGEEPVHTLEAIQQIAQQVGIDPALVAQAAVTLPAPGPASGRSLFGPPSNFRLTRQAAGALHSGDHAALVATIRDHLPEVGEVREFAGGLEWHSGKSDSMTVISLAPSPQGTLIRVDSRRFGMKFMLYLSAGTITALITLVSVAALTQLALALALGTLALSFGAARLFWDRSTRVARQRLERLLAALADQLR